VKVREELRAYFEVLNVSERSNLWGCELGLTGSGLYPLSFGFTSVE
jgi:hypothetical protein